MPAKTPASPPQLVACEGLDFYRITDDSLHVFQASKRIPPPHLRGSAAASHTARISVAEPLNVIVLGQERALVIGKQTVFLYPRGEKEARPIAPIPTPSKLFVWADERDHEAFWVHRLAEKAIHRYALPSRPGSAAEPARLSHSEEPLIGFDGRLFTVLRSGTPLYSTADGLTRPDDQDGPVPLPTLAPAPTLLFADASPGRYFTADRSGALSLRNREDPEPPVLTARVPGVVIDSAVEGERVAVLSMELETHSYRPTVTIFSKAEKLGQLAIGPSVASRGPHKLDLCLVRGRPWVVVGGKHWLQLLDYAAPRLLAEW